MSSLDYLDLCRLCLVKDGVSVPIFEGEGDVRQIFLKIAACLPVKVAREDKLPKKICDNCVYKVELLYQFWNTTANAEKQLLQWLGEVGLEDKQGYVTGVLNTSTMKEEDDASSVIQSSIATTTPQSGIGIGVIDNIGLGMPFSGTTHQQQLPPTIPINQPIHQALPGPSNQPAPDQLSQTQGNATTRPQDEEEESSEEEDNSDDDCDADDGLPVKEESEEDLGNSRNIEPTTFVNVSLACDEAGPSGLQQQKNTTEIPELSMPQTLNESDAKSGYSTIRLGRKIIKTDSAAKFILSKDSVLRELWQKLNLKGVPSYSLVPVRSTNKLRMKSGDKLIPANEIKAEINEDLISAKCATDIVTDPYHESLAHLCQVMIGCYPCDKCDIKFPIESMLRRHKSRNIRKSKLERLKKIRLRKSIVHARVKCDAIFSTQHLLDYHKWEHRVEKNVLYLCGICDFRCSKRTTLSSHFMRKHKIRDTVERSYTCKCGKFSCNHCKKNNLQAHMWTAKEQQNKRIFPCKLCDFKSNKRGTLASHMAKKHMPSKNVSMNRDSKAKEEFNCNICDFKTCEKENFQHHVQQHEESLDCGGPTSLSCTSCNFKCNKRAALASHVARKHKTTAEECRCNICDFKCLKKSTMYSHKRRHRAESDGTLYNCNECNFKTLKKASLYSHIKRKHKIQSLTGSTVDLITEYFYCNQCDYKNKNKYELKVHVARKHTDDFKFSCETCGKKFKVKGDLTNHIRFNHKEGPVICDVCGKTCLNSNSLYVHQKFAHYKAKYECKICKRRLVTQENLNEHMLRQHEKKENVVCEECGKTFSRNSRLKVHMRIHTGDKPYTCNICGKSFARRTALKQHLLIHTGIRPYVCDICGKSFTQKPGLISHRKSHPGSHPPLPRVLIDHILNDVMNN
ncbi:zinc finger protein 665-like isoform X1 [Athalia rosae]|uniref:zinc finger protein 665-like isoform X1 n=1 Tax=Athalia rosae TaxID=37344 RepID=UPI0020341ADE|nr:zinc finger protein 665-like isoform X1 [Athalia rosae]